MICSYFLLLKKSGAVTSLKVKACTFNASPVYEEREKALVWNQLTPPWQECIKEAWTAYCKGSLPIGSVITNAQGHILARGRNRIHEERGGDLHISGHQFAHAEINSLLQVDWNRVNPRSCILYSTTEPCPLCVGAIRMSFIGEVRYASRDEMAGSVQLFEATPFLRKGQIRVVGPQHSDLEIILIAMLIEFALHFTDAIPSSRYEQLVSIDSEGARLGKQLFTSNQLRRWKAEERAAAFVLDQIAHYYKTVKDS